MARSSPTTRPPSHKAPPKPPKPKKRDPIATGERDASVNRAASHNYELVERIETGIVLMGSEVKSIRSGRANLKDAYGMVRNGELWLLNLHIGTYENAGYSHHEPTRTRKLLAKADEIRKLIGKTQQRGMALVPTRMYFRNGKVKVELALARGKQLWDKRETERRKTAEREAREAIARSRKS